MRDFSWKVFTMTGNVDAYLLFKETEDELEDRSTDDEQSFKETDDIMKLGFH
jgi:hypothetical protein